MHERFRNNPSRELKRKERNRKDGVRIDSIVSKSVDVDKVLGKDRPVQIRCRDSSQYCFEKRNDKIGHEKRKKRIALFLFPFHGTKLQRFS